VEKMKDIADEIFATQPSVAFQYGITEGYPRLREQIKTRLRERFNTGTDDDDVIITTGGQQGIDLCAKVLCNEGDTVICENPSFIGALNAFRSTGAKLVGVDVDDDGMNIESLEKALKENPNAKLIYTIPTFHNPLGITMSLEKRKAVLSIAKKYRVPILEDNPYGELRFSGEDVPTIKSMDDEGIVAYTGSFSKILSAGMRVGFLCGHKDLLQKVTVCKQTNDVHTNLFFQMLCSKFIEKYGLDDHIKGICDLYRDNCQTMIAEMEKHFPESVKFTRPEGGLFLWCTLPEGIALSDFVNRAKDALVFVVPGTAFNCDESAPSDSFRLNYSMPSDEEIEKGIKILGDIIRDMMK
jgi:2-aminoadipate transaminase